MAVRMKDIARDLGVSVVTVSKVLRNHSDIGEETRQRVLKRVKELDYRPNLAARALVTGRTYSMGLVVPDLLHPFFAHVAKALSGILRKKGYSLVISSSEDDPELEQQEIEQLLTRRVDAILIASSQWTVESFRRIEEQHIPYILIDRRFAGLAANFVGVDDEAVGEIATTHLIEQGCTRIAHIQGPDVSTGIGRAEGYKRALAAKGLTPRMIPVGASGDDRGDTRGYEAMKQLLASGERPDGVFCYNDPVALGAMKAIFEAGLDIPRDIAVIGCGNVLYSDFLRVPLSTVDQSSASIGERAAKLALSLTEAKGAVRPKSIVVKPQLVPRASSLRADPK